jgi:uncharacterized protein DUF4398
MTRNLKRCAAVTSMLAAAALAGCAINPYPALEFAAAESALAEARDAGAAELAPGEWGLAQEKLRLGKRWVAAKDFKPARWLVEQAQVDAELATMKAMSARAVEGAALAARELRARNIRLARSAS